MLTLAPKRTVVKMLFGSHLFGTSTPESDVDYKTVVIPAARDLLLGTAKGSLVTGTSEERTANTAEDEDNEEMTLQYFLAHAIKGTTHVMDMLFAPDESIIESSYVWEQIRALRPDLVSKRVYAFVGYCRAQANVYSLKGERVAAVRAVVDYLQNLPQGNKLGDFESQLHAFAHAHPDHIQMHLRQANAKPEAPLVTYFEVCGKAAVLTGSVHQALTTFRKVLDNYGKRARLAEDAGGADWKAISHAIRIGQEALEVVTTGHITLPRPNAVFLRDVKQGKVDYKTAVTMVDDILADVTAALKVTTLPEDVDLEMVNDFVVQTYREQFIAV